MLNVIVIRPGVMNVTVDEHESIVEFFEKAIICYAACMHSVFNS